MVSKNAKGIVYFIHGVYFRCQYHIYDSMQTFNWLILASSLIISTPNVSLCQGDQCKFLKSCWRSHSRNTLLSYTEQHRWSSHWTISQSFPTILTSFPSIHSLANTFISYASTHALILPPYHSLRHVPSHPSLFIHSPFHTLQFLSLPQTCIHSFITPYTFIH